jgi:hypothetical protein
VTCNIIAYQVGDILALGSVDVIVHWLVDIIATSPVDITVPNVTCDVQ